MNVILFSLLYLTTISWTEINIISVRTPEVKMDFKLFSSAFKDGDFIPSKYTCDGLNVSPPLNWTDPPKGTKSFALINDDPDAPIGDWVHWVVFNIPADVTLLQEESSSKHLLPKGTIEGLNDFQKNNYGGPCPPSGTHRYFFKLYALDVTLTLKPSATKKQLLGAMKDHILAKPF